MMATATRNLPLSIHCLRAWGPLLECLRENPRPARGILLHGYGGSRELVNELVPLGAHFSFCGYFLAERKESVRDAFRVVPIDRLLIETDAPDMLPPSEHRLHPLRQENGAELNHPANLEGIASALADVLGTKSEELTAQLERNFQRFFLEN